MLHARFVDLVTKRCQFEATRKAIRTLVEVQDSQVRELASIHAEVASLAKDPVLIFEYFKGHPDFLLDVDTFNFLLFTFEWNTSEKVTSDSHILQMNALGGMELLDRVTHDVVGTLARPSNPLVSSNFLMLIFSFLCFLFIAS